MNIQSKPELQNINTKSAVLAAFAADLTYDDIPDSVVARMVDLFVDWVGSTFSGKGHRAIDIMEAFADAMGPRSGAAEILVNRQKTSAFFAALVNGSSSHISEQDDVHNGSVFHPAAVVFPAALAVAQETGASGKEFIVACIAGYEVGIRIGEFLGRSHYKVFHTTGTVGTLAAAAAAGKLYNLDLQSMLNAFGSAGTQSAGLWEFLRDAADSKQLHAGKSPAEGVLSAWLAHKGFTGASDILEGPQGMAAGMSSDANPDRLIDGLGGRWTVLETSFKFHSSCRHTHPSADAMLKVMTENNLKYGDVKSVVAYVHQAAIDVLGPVRHPQSVHQAKFCMAAVVGLIAVHGKAGVVAFSKVLQDDATLSFLDRVEMVFDPVIDAAYPQSWQGRVCVNTVDGQQFEAQVETPKGDPENTLSRTEIDTKVRSLVRFSDAVSERELDPLLARLWDVVNAKHCQNLIF